jgi:hypothetical protein
VAFDNSEGHPKHRQKARGIPHSADSVRNDVSVCGVLGDDIAPSASFPFESASAAWSITCAARIRLSALSRCGILGQSDAFGGTMPQSSTPLDSLLVTVVLATLALGLPIVFVLSIRFLWERSLNLGRSKELEKLIWQLHRIASAMEHQMSLSFPPVQPGTEEPHDLAYLQQIASPAPAAAPSVAASSSVAPTAKPQPAPQHPATPEPAAQQTSFPPLVPREPTAEVPRAGVNSMFGL